MIHLDRIEMRNFLSVEFTNMPIPKGLVLVEGDNRDSMSATSNGAGKSTLIEGIVWGLYGKTIRGLEADAVVRHGHPGGCLVKLEGRLDDRPFLIVRTRLPGGLRFWVSDRELTGPGMRDTQIEIERALGVSFVAFVNSAIFATRGVKNFMSLSDTERKSLFDELLSLERFELAYNRTKKLMDETEADIQRIEREIATAEGRVSQIDQDLRQHNQDLQIAIQTAESYRAEMEKQIEQAKIKLAEWQQKAQDLVDRKVVERKDETQKTQTVAEQELAQLTGQSIVLAQRVAVILDGTEGNCPACGQVINGDHLVRHRAEAQLELDHVRDQIAAQKIKVDEAQRIAKEAVRDWTELSNVRDEITKSERWIEQKVQQMQRDEQDNKAMTIRTLISRSQGQRNELADQITVLQGKLELSKERHRNLDFWRNAFGPKGIKSYIYDDILGYLNNIANEMALILTDGEVKIEFSTQAELKTGALRERFTVKVINSAGTDVYEANSGGETRKIDLCILLAINALIEQRTQSFSIVCLDEVFDALDEIGVERCMNVFHRMGKMSVLTVSHSPALKDQFDKVLTARKMGGRTEYVWEQGVAA